jgi:hypothetical protein
MAYMAIETLVKKLNGETVPEKIYFFRQIFALFRI